MQLLENVEDCYDEIVIPRCSFKTNAYASPHPSFVIESLSRMSFSYNKLPQEPLSLIVLKLDGSSFAIVVPKMGTVVHLKQGVEAAFNHLPKRGPGMVSWSHVWGHFCLSYDGKKLLTDADCIGDYGIRDGDMLHFVRHVSVVCNVVNEELDQEKYTFDEPTISECCKKSVSSCMESITHHVTVIEKKQQSNNKEDKGVVRYCRYKIACFMRGLFSYQKRLTSLDVKMKPSRLYQLNNNNYSKFQEPQMYLSGDADCIGDYGIRDGDILHFVRHVSVVCNVVNEELDQEKYTFDQPTTSECCKNNVSSCMEPINSHHVTVIEKKAAK